MTIKDIASRFFNRERGDDPWIVDCECAAGCPVCEELKKAGVLDAHVITGTCSMCGGSRFCPDCGDAPVSVIEPAAWERAMGCFTVDSLRGIDFEETLGRIAQALLPGARVATEVLTVHSPIAHESPLVTSLHKGAVTSGVEHYTTLRHGDTIAVLVDTREEAGE